MDSKKIRNQKHISKRFHRAGAKKLLDRPTYCPNKQEKTRVLRKKLLERANPDPIPSAPPKTLKFGSFNVNGLDIESSWAVDQLLDKRGYDVSVYNVTNVLHVLT